MFIFVVETDSAIRIVHALVLGRLINSKSIDF